MKKIIPHSIVLGLFWISVVVYFSPMVFQGKQLRQQDILQYQGMAKEIIDNRARYGEEPLWTNAMFSGMPSTMISMEHFGNLYRYVHKTLIKLTPYPSSLVLISLVAAYLMLLAFGAGILEAVLGAYAFSFSTFTFISLEAGHNAKVACMAYMPAVLAGMAWAYRRNVWIGASIVAVSIALQVVNNHVQITYYLALICISYALVEGITAFRKQQLKPFIRTSMIILAAAIFGLATHAGYFLSIKDYSTYSIRGKSILSPNASNAKDIPKDGLDREYVFSYSSGITEPLTWLIPNYFGGASAGSLARDSYTAKAFRENGIDSGTAAQYLAQMPLYFGDQPFVAGPMYMGAVVVFLVVLAMLIVKEPLKWALLGCSFIALLLTYGKNFPTLNYFLFDYFPLYNKFRSVTMAVVIPQLCFSVLAGLGLMTFLKIKDKKQLFRPLLYSTASTAGICLFVFLIAGGADYTSPMDSYYQFPEWLSEALQEDRKAMRIGDALRSAMLILVATALLWAYLQNKLQKNWTLGLMALLSVGDLWLINRRYLNNENFEKKVFDTYYTPTEANLRILQDTDPHYRVFNLNNPFNDAKTSYFHRSVGGYSPAKLRRYQDLIERKLAPELERTLANLRKTGQLDPQTIPILNMLDTRYLIAGTEASMVIPNPGALGAAWFVERLKTVENNDEEMELTGLYDPARIAIVNRSEFGVSEQTFNPDTAASIVLDPGSKPYDLIYTYTSKTDGFIVFSEIHYPKGWTATIDGKEAPIYRVNYVLRGLFAPAGSHTIRFIFKNDAYTTGNTIGLIASLAILFVVLGTIWWVRKDTRNKAL